MYIPRPSLGSLSLLPPHPTQGASDNKDGGQCSIVLRLSNGGEVTPDAGCGWLELARRDKARALRFRASVFVNGSKVKYCVNRFNVQYDVNGFKVN